MHPHVYRTGILSVALIFFASGWFSHDKKIKAEKDDLKNHEELSLPIAGKKLVIAHCMTNIIRYKGHKMEDSCNPEYYPPYGNITATLGGLTQVVPLTDSF